MERCVEWLAMGRRRQVVEGRQGSSSDDGSGGSIRVLLVEAGSAIYSIAVGVVLLMYL